MNNYQNFLTELRSAISVELHEESRLSDSSFLNNTIHFLETEKPQVLRWVKALHDEELSIKDFQFLLAAQEELLAIRDLKKAGLKATQQERLRKRLIQLIVSKTSTLL